MSERLRSRLRTKSLTICKSVCPPVRRILSSHGYFRARSRRKPILSAKNSKDRLAWAAANEKQDWSRVIFTDEAAFELGDDQAHEMCWRLPHEEYNAACLTPIKKRRQDGERLGCDCERPEVPTCPFRFVTSTSRGWQKNCRSNEKCKSLCSSDSEGL
jgi:hypothetical protein